MPGSRYKKLMTRAPFTSAKQPFEDIVKSDEAGVAPVVSYTAIAHLPPQLWSALPLQGKSQMAILFAPTGSSMDKPQKHCKTIEKRMQGTGVDEVTSRESNVSWPGLAECFTACPNLVRWKACSMRTDGRHMHSNRAVHTPIARHTLYPQQA